VREESRVRERDFRNFQVEERMKVIKEIYECFKRFLYQEENFNFLHLRRKLKLHIFSCLKFKKFKFFIKKIQTMNFRLQKFKFSDKLLFSVKILYPNVLRCIFEFVFHNGILRNRSMIKIGYDIIKYEGRIR